MFLHRFSQKSLVYQKNCFTVNIFSHCQLLFECFILTTLYSSFMLWSSVELFQLCFWKGIQHEDWALRTVQLNVHLLSRQTVVLVLIPLSEKSTELFFLALNYVKKIKWEELIVLVNTYQFCTMQLKQATGTWIRKTKAWKHITREINCFVMCRFCGNGRK